MRTLLALGAALCLAAAALPARADGPGDLQARARSLQLADDPAWADLLQYEPHPLTRRLRSLADDPGFFNAPDGARSPAAELDATLARLFEPARPEAPDSHPQCRFPARLHWLRTRLGIDTATLPAQPCPRLEAWMAEINPAGVTLVFPSAYVNSPASMFGHTLLRIDAVGQTEATRLLAYTINYAAKADASDGFSFALKGLTGLYPGMLSSSPYYVKVREYSDMESRDVWEYQLNLSTAETRQLLRHAWEIGATRFDYWFFDENCSYMMLRLLDVARPGLRLSQQFFWTAIPVDTVKGVVAATPGLVTDIHFRASAGTELAHRAGRLAPAQLEAAIAVADGGTTPESLGDSPLAIEQLEFADRLVAFRGHGGKLGQEYEWVRGAIREYIDEEYGHQEWILNDIRACGGDAEAVRHGQPGLPIELMVAFLYDQIQRGNPMGFFGMVQVLEGTSVAIALTVADQLKSGLGLPPQAMSYLSSHGALDQEHLKFFESLMNRVEDAADQAAIIHAAKVVYRLYGDMLYQLTGSCQ
jgi:hypothetical protein